MLQVSLALASAVGVRSDAVYWVLLVGFQPHTIDDPQRPLSDWLSANTGNHLRMNWIATSLSSDLTLFVSELPVGDPRLLLQMPHGTF